MDDGARSLRRGGDGGSPFRIAAIRSVPTFFDWRSALDHDRHASLPTQARLLGDTGVAGIVNSTRSASGPSRVVRSKARRAPA